MSRIPNVTIGAHTFIELYPHWGEVLDALGDALQAELSPDPISGVSNTPRAYLADENRFLNFFTKFITEHPEFEISKDQVADVYLYAHDEFFGMGLLRVWLDDPEVEDILMNSYKHVDVVKKGVKHLFHSPFVDNADAYHWMQRILSHQNKQLSENNPVENSQLSDGSRIICLVPPVVDTCGFSIRKHRAERFQRDAYIASGVAPLEFFDDIATWIQDRHNMLISGATGSGKTTFINYAASLIDADERILVVEDTRELLIPHPRVYQMSTVQRGSRESQNQESGALTIRDLVKHTLRMKPDRIIVGEVRGPEAFDMLNAMNTGHDGGITTLHANSPSEAILRLESLASPANPNMPLWALQDLIGATIGIVIQMKQRPKSSTRVVVEASQIFHPSQILDKRDLEPPTRELRGERIYLRPLWLWNEEHEQLEKHADPVELHGQYF